MNENVRNSLKKRAKLTTKMAGKNKTMKNCKHKLKTFFAICSPVNNTSILPCCQRVRKYFTMFTLINSCHLSENDISSIIKSLDSKKVHGCDNISIKMIHICGEAITVLLIMIFEESLRKGKFPETCEKANKALVYRKKKD